MWSRDSDTHIFRSLKAPELEELGACFESGEHPADAMNEDPHATGYVSNFLHFLEQSQRTTSLHHLRIHSLPVSRRGLRRMLRPLHGLHHLTIDDVPITRDLFSVLLSFPCLRKSSSRSLRSWNYSIYPASSNGSVSLWISRAGLRGRSVGTWNTWISLWRRWTAVPSF
jgi:hypothetical protein